MYTYLLNWWDAIRSSFWFVPSALGIAALALGVGMPLADGALHDFSVEHTPGIQTTTGAARATLSAIAGAMVTVAGTVFSITVVVLSLTSSQFGPRLLRTFMLDMPTQWTLGIFVSTSLYCLLVLHAVQPSDDGDSAPHLSVLLAVVLAVLCLAFLIFFVHHISVLIQAPRVVQAVAGELDDAIVRLFPDRIGESADDESASDKAIHAAALAQAEQLGQAGHQIVATKEGYIQALDTAGVLEEARENDLIFGMRFRPGDFLRRDAVLADIWAPQDVSPETVKKIETAINEAVIVGMRRTPRQDVECAVNELVEVAVRALSPGINDPFTAMSCTDRLVSSLMRLAQREMPSPIRCDADGQLRVIASHSTKFGSVLDASFNQIRQYGRGCAPVLIRLLEGLLYIADVVSRDEDRAAIRRHADMIWRNGQESLQEEWDRREVQERYDRVLESLTESKSS